MARSIRISASLLALAVLAAPAAAELRLPKKTIVVRDFARRRQDLLDTLRVNIPDAEVEISQFRGAEVLLEVKLEPDTPLGDRAAAERQLRRHCDQLIRRAYPGMRLSGDSIFLLRGPEERARSRSKDLLGRLRGALGKITGRKVEEEEAELDPLSEAEREGMREDMVDTGAEHRYRELLAKKRAEAKEAVREQMKVEIAMPAVQPKPAAPVAARQAPAAKPGAEKTAAQPAAVPLLSPETAQALARYPARPAPAASGKVRERLVRQARRQDLIQRLKASRGISMDTITKMEKFHQEGGGEVLSSQETVRRIYASIFEDRRRAAAPADPTVAFEEPLLTSSGSEPAQGEPPPAGKPDPDPVEWDDGAFHQQVESMFETAGKPSPVVQPSSAW